MDNEVSKDDLDYCYLMREISGKHIRGDHSLCHPRLCPYLKGKQFITFDGIGKEIVRLVREAEESKGKWEV